MCLGILISFLADFPVLSNGVMISSVRRLAGCFEALQKEITHLMGKPVGQRQRGEIWLSIRHGDGLDDVKGRCNGSAPSNAVWSARLQVVTQQTANAQHKERSGIKGFCPPRLGCDLLTERFFWCPKKRTGRISGWASVRAIRDIGQ